MDFKNFVLVFCNGEPPTRQRIKNLIPLPKLIACADGGANKAASLDYKPDLIIGDLDSFNDEGKIFEEAEIIRVSSQENTDFEKTLSLLLDRGFHAFLVVAFSGGRIDQTLANLQIACEYSKKSEIILADENYMVFPVSERFETEILGGTEISIIPMEDETNVTTNGLKYELHRAFLKKGGRGISNSSLENKIEITVHIGSVLVFIKNV